MAACSLFEEDVVCHVTPDNGYIYGLVLENSETVSSDEEDPPRQDICKRGCVRVAWHPKGKESYNTPENKVLLADRSVMVADVVRRFVPGEETQCGLVQDVQVTCHLHITGTDKYIYDVDSKLLSQCIQLQRFENGYVTLDNWLGRVEEVVENIRLLLPDGAKCEVDDSDASYLEDISEKRPETVTFNEEYWYPGQQLRGEMGNLCNANWVNPTLLHNSKNVENKKNSTFYAVVDAVSIRYIYVYWICCGYSKASLPANQSMPQCKVEGDDISRLQIVDSFEHCAVKLGDKVYYTVREEDVVESQPLRHRFVPHAARGLSPQRLAQVTHKTEDLYRQRFDESTGKHRRRGSKRNMESAASASSSNTTATTVVSSLSAHSLPEGGATGGDMEHKPMDTEKPKEKQEEEFKDGVAASVERGGGDPEADLDADDEYEDVDDDKKDGAESDDGSLSSSASGPKRRKRDRGGIGVSIRTLRKTSRQARRTRPVAEISVKPGSRVATEVSYTFGMATVLWQDGNLEKNIPSVDLYPMHHLDDLEYFPGSYIVDSSASDTSNEYGVITSCNRFERTCQVKWFKPYEVGRGKRPTEVIKDSEVSVYDIRDHPDYKFRPGNSVIRVSGFEDTEQTLQAVGQVMCLEPMGTVYVHWSDGSYTSSFPQDLYIVWDMSDYSNSSSEVESTDSEELDSEEGNSNDSWETEEEVEVWKPDGDAIDASQSEEEAKEDDEEERNLKFKDMDEQWTAEIKRLMNRIAGCFEVINEQYSAIYASSPVAIQEVIASHPILVSVLKGVLKAYRAWHKLEKQVKTGLGSCESVAIVSLVGSIKYNIKREKTNKIKQHLAHVFESSNKGLLDQARRVEVATDTAGLLMDAQGAGAEGLAQDPPPPVSGAQSSSQASGVQSPSPGSGVSNGKVQKEEAGTSVDMELGSSVDSCAQGVSPTNKSAGPDKVQDVEKDISSRLAAANVEESIASTGEKKVSADQSLLSDAAAGGEEKQTNAGDKELAQLAPLLDVVKKNLCSIQECLNEMTTVIKSAQKKYESKAQRKLAEDEDKKAKKDGKSEGDSCAPNVLGKDGNSSGVDMEVLGGSVDVDGRSDNLEATENGPCPMVSEDKAEEDAMADGSAGEEEEVEEEIVNPPGLVLPQGFFLHGSAPSCHSYIDKTCMPSNPKKFNSAIKKELKLMQSSLPHGILVKGYSDRMDLFSVLIDGPCGTPYEDGMFMFDVMLPHDYPFSPPMFHYLSYESDRLNPNLYVDGKVCVSLLGTWSGKGMEMWTDQSNLLQVLVSIQGLILVDEPYYNEAGYERQRGQQIALENSRMYNEMALLRLVEGMTLMSADPPMPFNQEVRERLKVNGPRLIARLRKWVALSESTADRQRLATSDRAEKCAENGAPSVESVKDVSPTHGEDGASEGLAEQPSHDIPEPAAKSLPPPGHPSFPLLPMSKGFRVTLQKSVVKLERALEKLKTEEGAAGGASESTRESGDEEPEPMTS